MIPHRNVAVMFDPRLLESSHVLTNLALCQARLQADARWPWIVLIPRRPALREIEDLTQADQMQLTAEIVAAGRAVRAVAVALGRPAQKLNVGQLGNIVAQLHIHVIGRRADDLAWPGPVWGFGAPVAYEQPTLELAIESARGALKLV
ncbi:MAG: HIT domain-containing protein [Caulobacteraceae bacterium]